VPLHRENPCDLDQKKGKRREKSAERVFAPNSDMGKKKKKGGRGRGEREADTSLSITGKEEGKQEKRQQSAITIILQDFGKKKGRGRGLHLLRGRGKHRTPAACRAQNRTLKKKRGRRDILVIRTETRRKKRNATD